jgi:hypothetical protein
MGDMLWLDGKGDFLDIMTENQISAADRDTLSYVASSPIQLKLFVLLRKVQEIHIVNGFSRLSY